MPVTSYSAAELQDVIDRLQRGDLSARRELLQRAHDHLSRIAGSMFHQDFPGLRGRHDLESVVSEVWIRLATALEATQPSTVEGFLGLVFHKVRQVLYDMASRQRRDDANGGRLDGGQGDSWGIAGVEVPDTTHEPARLAILTEFHEQVERLPAAERTVFEMRYYGGFSQAEIAQILNLPAKQVSRRWLAATGRLAVWFKGVAPPF